MAAKWPWFAGAYAGLWLATQAAKPKDARTLSAGQANRLVDKLSNFRAPFRVPIAMVTDPVVVGSLWLGIASKLYPGEMSAQVAIRQAVDADRFVFADSIVLSTPLPGRFDVAMVKPASVRAFAESKPDWVIIAAPEGYLSDGRPLRSIEG